LSRLSPGISVEKVRPLVMKLVRLSHTNDNRTGKEHMRLCYSHVSASHIEEGVRRLGHLLSES